MEFFCGEQLDKIVLFRLYIKRKKVSWKATKFLSNLLHGQISDVSQNTSRSNRNLRWGLKRPLIKGGLNLTESITSDKEFNSQIPQADKSTLCPGPPTIVLNPWTTLESRHKQFQSLSRNWAENSSKKLEELSCLFFSIIPPIWYIFSIRNMEAVSNWNYLRNNETSMNQQSTHIFSSFSVVSWEKYGRCRLINFISKTDVQTWHSTFSQMRQKQQSASWHICKTHPCDRKLTRSTYQTHVNSKLITSQGNFTEFLSRCRYCKNMT